MKHNSGENMKVKAFTLQVYGMFLVDLDTRKGYQWAREKDAVWTVDKLDLEEKLKKAPQGTTLIERDFEINLDADPWEYPISKDEVLAKYQHVFQSNGNEYTFLRHDGSAMFIQNPHGAEIKFPLKNRDIWTQANPVNVWAKKLADKIVEELGGISEFEKDDIVQDAVGEIFRVKCISKDITQLYNYKNNLVNRPTKELTKVEYDIVIEEGKKYKLEGTCPLGVSAFNNYKAIATSLYNGALGLWKSDTGLIFSPLNVDAEIQEEDSLVEKYAEDDVKNTSELYNQEEENMIKPLTQEEHPVLYKHGFRSALFQGDQILEAYKKQIFDLTVPEKIEMIFIIQDEDRYIEGVTWNQEAAEYFAEKRGGSVETFAPITEADLA